MKKLLLITTCIVMSHALFSQVNWVKYPDNPVLVKQNFLTEFYAIGQPAVIMENDTLKMWYVACGIDHKGRVLYAWSIDGRTWTKYGDGAIVMDVDSAGSWDDTWTDTPEIVHGPTGYFLYFLGDSVTDVPPDQNNLPTTAFGVATSPDGIHWTRFSGNPILARGDTDSWENFWIESPAVLWDSATNQFMMWYSGVNKNWLIQTGLATSPDGLNWTKYSGNPVITYGPPGSYDDMWVAVPSVIRNNNRFEMWYDAFNSRAGWDTIFICFATSPDGINWTKYEGNPLFHTYTPPSDTNVDKHGPWACDVVFDSDSNIYKMWYETAAGFCYATSDVTLGIHQNMVYKNDFTVFPNPADVRTTLNFSLQKNEHVMIKLFDYTGKEIATLSDSFFEKGTHTVSFPSGYLRTGVYYIKLQTASSVQTKMMEIVK